jgi:type IV pilus assembly protein PilY1
MKWIKLTLVASLFVSGLRAQADDIEIYLQGATATGQPYLTLIVDYRPSVFNNLCTYGSGRSCEPPFMSQDVYDALTSAGFSDGNAVSTFDAFVAVLEVVIQNTDYDPVKVSILAPNKNDGGTILQGFTQLGTGRTDIIQTLRTLQSPPNASAAHLFQPKETFLEWHRYLNGAEVLNGTLTQGNYNSGNTNSPNPDYDPSIVDTLGSGTYGDYITPFTDPSACPKMYSMVVAMNADNQDDDWNDEIEAEMTPLDRQSTFEFLLKWMHRTDTNLIDHLNDNTFMQKSWIITDPRAVGRTPDWADAGGSGSPLDLQDPAALEVDLDNALREVISVSSTFVAASVPVNVFNQAESLDNLYVALFQAKATQKWPGNLKKLRLVDNFDPADPNNPDARDGIFDEAVDVNGDPGFESVGDDRGRITFDAQTYWTDTDTLPDADGTTVPIGVDGREVARGGAGQKIDGFVAYGGNHHFIGDSNSDATMFGDGPRQVFIEPASITNGSQNSFTAFNVPSTIPADARGLLDPNDPSSLSDSDVEDLVKWGRGQDVDNNTSNARSWLLGDIIHSRPFALNYGATGNGYDVDNPNIRIFMGTGDGMFHIFENTDNSGNETGREVFAFYPREMLKNIKLRREDSLSATQMIYGVDGSPVVFTDDQNSDGTLDHSVGDKTYVIFGLRRGGNSYYALDVSDPDNTYLLWKITQTADGDFDELGMTFSTPVVGQIEVGGVETDVAIFAGGYNGGWDSTYTNRVGKDLNDNDDSEGNAIYIVNVHTGALVWKTIQGTTGTSSNSHYEHAGMVDSIPSNVSVLKNLKGHIHRVYVGDTGGSVWRVDLPEDDGSNSNFRRDHWFTTKLADLGEDGTSSDRRFFHQPDLVETFDSAGNFDGLLIESGNRADPNETDVENFMFYIKDRKTTTGDATVQAENAVSNPPGRYVFDDSETNGLADQTDCVIGTESDCNVSLLNGWKIEMERDGEKGLAAPLTDGGRVFFTTFKPGTPGSCSPAEGDGSIYVVNLADGTATANNQRYYDIGPGIPPGALLIGDVILLPGGGIDLYDIDGDGERDTTNLPESQARKFYNIYWREPGIDQL